MEVNLLLMGKLFLMILNIMRSGSGTMPVPMKDLGAMIGPATLTGQGTLRGEGRTCRTSRTEMHLLGSRDSTALHLA
jgi:hypothetical protein